MSCLKGLEQVGSLDHSLVYLFVVLLDCFKDHLILTNGFIESTLIHAIVLSICNFDWRFTTWVFGHVKSTPDVRQLLCWSHLLNNLEGLFTCHLDWTHTTCINWWPSTNVLHKVIFRISGLVYQLMWSIWAASLINNRNWSWSLSYLTLWPWSAT